MDMLGGGLLGFGLGVALFWFLTPPEYRPALLARLRSKSSAVHDRIAAAIAAARHKKDDDPPATPGA